MLETVTVITTIASIITALTVIIGAVVGIFKFTKKISKRLETLDNLEKFNENNLTFEQDFEDMKNGIKDVAQNLKDLNERFSKHILKDVEKEERADETLRLIKALKESSEKQAEENEKQRELLLQETRNYLIDAMQTALNVGYVNSIEEIERIGDLFGAYTEYGGNHGVGAVFAKYKKLKLKSEIKGGEV